MAATHPVQSPNLIAAFAQTQLTAVKTQRIRESSLLELAACAFLCGAAEQLKKQSNADAADNHRQLIGLIREVCHVAEGNAEGLVESVNKLSRKYYLLENITDQGRGAADRWLACEDADDKVLQRLMDKYQNLTMFELGIEGINEQWEEQQDKLYTDIDQSVGKLRRRAGLFILITIALAAGVAILTSHYL
jgi:hypothetical protein